MTLPRYTHTDTHMQPDDSGQWVRAEDVNTLSRTILAQDAEIERLREALGPFARIADYMGGFDPADEFVLIYKEMIESGDTSWNAGSFLLRHFYEARAALGGLQ